MKLKQAFFGGLAALLLTIGFSGCPSPVQPPHPKSPNTSESSDTSSYTPPKPPSTPPKTETKTGITNSSGQVSFTDNSTLEQVLISVVDKQGSPVQNAKTTYWSGDSFRVYLAEDPSGNYLPSLGIYSHNSEHTIETGKMGDSFYKIATIDENSTSIGKVIYTWKDKNGMNFSTYNYYNTVDYNEYLQIKGRNEEVLDLIWKGIETLTGISLPKKPSEIINYLFPESKNPPQRWDVYTYNDGYGQSAILTMIPSNIPTVAINTPAINGSGVKLSWLGADKDTYDQFTFLPDNKDLTRYVDGNTTSDLTYSYEITKDGKVYGNYSWTSYSSGTSTTVNLSDSGKYSLEVRVKDEVNNVGSSSSDFLIAPQPVKHKLDISPSQDAYILTGYWSNGDKYYKGFNNDKLYIYQLLPLGEVDDALVQIPVSSIPTGSKVNSAWLELYGSGLTNYTNSKSLIQVKKITSPWSELTVTGKNKPSYGSDIITSLYVGRTEGWYKLDVTSLVQGWVNGSPNYGLTIVPGDNQESATFKSSDYMDNPNLRPKLEVIYETKN